MTRLCPCLLTERLLLEASGDVMSGGAVMLLTGRNVVMGLARSGGIALEKRSVHHATQGLQSPCLVGRRGGVGQVRCCQVGGETVERRSSGGPAARTWIGARDRIRIDCLLFESL